ncbi:MAG TPA: UPF0236 family protein, partial [Allocoleopsis sp.]
VVICDGARVIRQRVSRLFTPGVVTSLDGYHLCEKLRQLMSMISLNRDQKRIDLKRILSDLWHGQVESVLDYLKSQVMSKNPEKFQELVGYLEKHRHEIIDYDRRHKVGKTVGSGRMEKAVDQVFGHRQKHKGMSWRPQGSRALAYPQGDRTQRQVAADLVSPMIFVVITGKFTGGIFTRCLSLKTMLEFLSLAVECHFPPITTIYLPTLKINL